MKRLAIFAFALFSALATAQTVQPILQPHQQFVDGSGNPCSLCLLYSYAAGTTTPLATYTDSSGTVQNSNPVVLDVTGGASVWVGSSAYKFVLKTALGSTVWTVDNVPGSASSRYLALSGGTLSGTLNGTSAAFSGNVTASGNLTGTTTNGVLNAAQFSGADIGAKINTAAAAIQSSTANGGVIYVPAGNYSFSTPIALTTSKPISVLCAEGANSSSATLTYTGTGTMFTYNPTGGGMIRGCSFVGPGSGTATVGLYFGGTNLTNDLSVEGVAVSGFGIGEEFGSNAWLINHFNYRSMNNGQDVFFPSGSTNSGESIRYFGGVFAQTAATMTSNNLQFDNAGAEISFDGTSFDSRSVTITAGLHFSFSNAHFEKPNGASTTPWITYNGAQTLAVTDCSFYEGYAAGGENGFIVVGGTSYNTVSVTGGNAYSAGTPTALVYSTSANAQIHIDSTRIYGVANYQSGSYGNLYIVGSDGHVTTSGALSAGSVSTGGNVSATGSVSGGSMSTSGTLNAGAVSTGNITATGWILAQTNSAFTNLGNFGIRFTPSADSGLPSLIYGTNAANNATTWKFDQSGNFSTTGTIGAGNSSQIIYRCTTAGALPVGALTVATGNCGASVDSGLRGN